MKEMYRWCKDVVQNPQSKHFFLVRDILALLTIISILSIVLETVPSFSKWQVVFSTIEWVTVLFFAAEYVLRFLFTKPKRAYAFSFYGVIDLVSILPTFLMIGNFTFLKTARILRLLRLLRMVRLAKLSRLKADDVDESINIYTLNISIYGVLLFGCLLLFGTLAYVFEAPAPDFLSVPHAMWWSFKVFLGSIPVEAPLTILGGILFVFARFVGLILFGVMISVVVNIFTHVLLTKRQSSK